MKHPRMKELIVRSLLCLGASAGLTACVDDSYDLSKDIDMTMQLGTEGLQVKLGTTEKILLADILEIDDEEMIEETPNGLYYLIEDGQTDFNFDIPTIRTKIDIASLIPDTRIFDYDKYISLIPDEIFEDLKVPAGEVFGTDEPIGATQGFKFKQNDIPIEVKSIKRIMPSEETNTFRIKLGIQTNDDARLAFVLNDITDFRIKLPYFIKCTSPSEGITLDEKTNSLIVNDRININSKSLDLGTFQLQCVEAKGDLGLTVVEEYGERILAIEDEIGFQGNFSIKTNKEFSIKKGDFAKVEFDMVLDGYQNEDMVDIVLDKVTGIYDPIIDPVVDPIDISNDLPDFLNDDDVVMDVANPTIRFDIDMSEIPTNINFYSELSGYKNNQKASEVRLPETGIGTLSQMKNNRLYFFQGEQPFDPNGVTEDSQTFLVSNLSNLVKKIPDEIHVDLSQGHIQLKQDELQTIELGRNYAAHADYTVYVPFQFNNGLNVVYKDSTESFEDDLQDYEAQGATVTATIASTIPLKLTATAVPVDIQGNEINDITVSHAYINPAGNDGVEVETQIQLELDLTDPAALKRVDRINFRIEAGAKNNGMLTSKQYLLVKDVRLKLKGAVIADFN